MMLHCKKTKHMLKKGGKICSSTVTSPRWKRMGKHCYEDATGLGGGWHRSSRITTVAKMCYSSKLALSFLSWDALQSHSITMVILSNRSSTADETLI